MQVADWLRASSDDSCIFGRIGGDTFGSCFPKKLFLPEVLEKELSNFKVQMGNNSYHLDIHIGFCDVNDDDQDVSILFDRAFMALDSIRNNQKKHVAFFDKKIRDRMLLNQEISSELETAIEENQIFPYLQPIADRNGKIIGAEALVRWIHPKRGFMSPAEFIPLFEDNGMIVDVDKHVWRSACRILAGWKNKYPELFISVNVSPKDFYLTDVYSDIKGLVDWRQGTVLCIPQTASADMARFIEIVMGVGIAARTVIEVFGTGGVGIADDLASFLIAQKLILGY